MYIHILIWISFSISLYFSLASQLEDPNLQMQTLFITIRLKTLKGNAHALN